MLPPGLRQLREPVAVCREAWDFLALTPMGCRMLAELDVRARLLLLPGSCGTGCFWAETVVTYGLSPRDSITFSSLREPVLCVQRRLTDLHGTVIEPQELPLPPDWTRFEAEPLLLLAGARLLLGLPLLFSPRD